MTAKPTPKTEKPKTAAAKPKTEEPTSRLRILKVGTCPSLSGASTLTYHIGYDSEIRFRVWGNTGGGLHGREWVAWSVIEPALQAEKLTAGTLRLLFRGKSRNTPGFLLAVLRAEGLVQAQEDQGHTRADPAAFLAAMEALIASDTNIKIPEQKAPAKPTRKASR